MIQAIAVMQCEVIDLVLADRISRLGSETAFAVSQEAAAHAAKGGKVYPFHLGDLNLPTPENIVEASFKAIRDGKTGYSPVAGIPPLREALAADVNLSHGMDYTPDCVVIEPGGKPVIGKFIQALMNPGDEVLYPDPGYPIYESQIEYHGGIAVPYGYRELDDCFELKLEELERKITPRTRLLIFNDFQNPMAAEAGEAERQRLAELACQHGLYVLCDEAYWDIRYSGQSGSLAALPGMAERCVLLYTFSKKFAMTGWRLGAAIAPREIAAVIAKLNVNDESCTNHFVQYGALAGLTGDQSGPRRILETLRGRRDMAVRILNTIPGVRCLKPETTFYLFPRVTGLMQKLGQKTYDELRRTLLEATGVSFCTRQHFGRELPGETERYIRFAYSGIDLDQLEEGLMKMKTYVEAVAQ